MRARIPTRRAGSGASASAGEGSRLGGSTHRTVKGASWKRGDEPTPFLDLLVTSEER